MKPRYKRGAVIAAGLCAIGVAALFVLNALSSNIALYVTPSDVASGMSPKGQPFRIGGMVKQGSLKRDQLVVHFVVTDMAQDVAVSFQGILPDLFKEGAGAVIQGRLEPDGSFSASEVLAKHDENYMPPEAKRSLDEARKSADVAKP